MVAILQGWATDILNHPAQINHRGYQSYTVLSLCRILYTLHSGAVVSKPVAARWAQETWGERWRPLIARAWIGRQHPQEQEQAQTDEVHETLDFIRYTLARSRQGEQSTEEV
jgi:Aminoglycoside adenylyltransferase, C-terminal domain